MRSTGFEIVSSSDDQIVVGDIETGWVFMYLVITTELGDHILGPSSFMPNDRARGRAEDIARPVWNFAQMQMHQAGRIDRMFIK